MKMKMIYYWSKQGEGLDGLRVFDGKGKCENAPASFLRAFASIDPSIALLPLLCYFLHKFLSAFLLFW